MHSLTQTGLAVGKLASANKPIYQRHQPEQTLLYQLLEKYHPAFLEHQIAEGRSLPDDVQQEFTDFIKCGRLEHGFLRVRCESCHHEKLVAFSLLLLCIHAVSGWCLCPARIQSPLLQAHPTTYSRATLQFVAPH